MHVDVEDLRDFYKSHLGLMVRRIVGHRIRARWRPARGGVIVGLGFASPYLGTFCGEALRVGAFMPEAQGALIWPAAGPVRTVLCEEERLPIPDNSVDRLLVVHCLEVAARSDVLLREMWRVLTPEGRLLLVVPNRRGLWARLDTTPFGVGRPYSRSQLERLLTGAMFTPTDWTGALFVPPFDRRIITRSALAMERLGSRISPAIAGVLMVEARKDTSAPAGKAVRVTALRDLVRRPRTSPLVLNK